MLEATLEQHASEITTLQNEQKAHVADLTHECDQAQTRAKSIEAERDRVQGELANMTMARGKFADDFATRVLDPEVIELLRRNVADHTPDGFDDQRWLLASLVWQLKAQNGYAEFLAGEKAYRVELRFKEGGDIEFEWDESRSAVADLLTQERGKYDAETLSRVNESINRYGFFPLVPDKIIARGIDGGILLASPGF